MQVPQWSEIPTRAKYSIRNTYTYATYLCIKLCQIVMTPVRYFSCYHDQDHVHSTSMCWLLHWKLRKNMPSIHPTISSTNECPRIKILPIHIPSPVRSVPTPAGKIAIPSSSKRALRLSQSALSQLVVCTLQAILTVGSGTDGSDSTN